MFESVLVFILNGLSSVFFYETSTKWEWLMILVGELDLVVSNLSNKIDTPMKTVDCSLFSSMIDL